MPAPNKSRQQLAHLLDIALHLTWTVRQIAICFTHALYHPRERISHWAIVLRVFFFFLNAFPSYPWDKASYIMLPPTPKLNLCVLVPLIASSPQQLYTLMKSSHLCDDFTSFSVENYSTLQLPPGTWSRARRLGEQGTQPPRSQTGAQLAKQRADLTHFFRRLDKQ